MEFLSDRSSKQRFITTYFAFIANGMLALSVGSLLPFIRDARGLNYAFAGLIVSLHSVGNFCSSFFSGILAASIGRKRSILLFDICFPVAYLLIIAGRGNFLIALAFLLTGLARGANSNYCNAVINELAPGKAWILNGLHAMFSVGAFLFPIILTLITKNDPARWVIACGFMLVMGILSFTLYAICPQGEKNASVDQNGTEKTLDSDETNGKKTEPENKITDDIEIDKGFGFFKEKIFWITILTLFFYLCAEQGVIGWMVTYFTDTGFISKSLSQLTASILWIMMLTGRLLVAWASTRVDKRKLLPIMGIGIVFFFILLLFARSAALIVVCIMGFGFSMAGIYPTTVSFTGKLIRKYSLAWSFILTMASFGSILMPSIIGHIAENAGIYYGICSDAAAVVLDFICILALVRVSKET